MENSLIALSKKLENRQAVAHTLVEAHSRAAESFGRRNNALTLAAVVSSALTGTSAIWSAIAASVSSPLPLALWGTALAGFITTIVTGAQRTSWGGAEEATKHQKAAAEFAAVARAAQAAVEIATEEKELREALAKVDERTNQIGSSAPFLSDKFKSRAGHAIKLEKLSEVGLVDAYETRDTGEAAAILADGFRKKPSKVQILETWTGYGAQLHTWISTAVEGGAEVQILLLDPASEHVEHRAQALSSTGVTAQMIKNHIEGDLDILGRILKAGDQNGSSEGTLEVRVYNVPPVVNMYRFDEIRIIGMYLWGEDSITGPQFEITGTEGPRQTPLAGDFDAHFTKIWDYTGKNPTKQVTVENGKLVTKSLREEEEETIPES